MIKGTFRIGGDIVEVIIDKENLLFRDTSTMTTTTIEGLKLSKGGVIKEFPDLKDNNNWKKIALDRLKEHIKKMNGEIDKINYVKEELIKYGYNPLYFQKAGWREKKW